MVVWGWCLNFRQGSVEVIAKGGILFLELLVGLGHALAAHLIELGGRGAADEDLAVLDAQVREKILDVGGWLRSTSK